MGGVGGVIRVRRMTRDDGTEEGEEGKGEGGGGEILAHGMGWPIKGSNRGPRGPKKGNGLEKEKDC